MIHVSFSGVKMANVSAKDGNVMGIMTVGTELMEHRALMRIQNNANQVRTNYN